MKTLRIRFLWALLLPVSIQAATLTADQVSKKYGKINPEEMSMTEYAADTSADAVVLYQRSSTYFDYNMTSGFKRICDFSRRIKVLKQNGTNEANISLTYYYNTNSDREVVSGLDAFAYNMENGKMVKTKMEKKYIFDEESSSNYHRIKFSIQNVKVGTVIEYKFSRSTDYVTSLPEWNIQQDIPVLNSLYEIRIPEYFVFSIEQKGYEWLDVSETSENQNLIVSSGSDGSNTVQCTNRIIKCTATDLPALKDEDYVWCLEDFLTGMRFELKGTNFPYSLYKSYSQTWDELDKTIKENTDFCANMKVSNPWKDEIKTLTASITEEKDKIEKIYEFVKKRVRWNEIYSFMGESPKEAAKNGTGNNAQINFLLMSALKDAGIKNYPILINRRSQGRLPLTHASLSKLNTFVTCAETSDGKRFFMDGSATYGGVNMLPTDLMVDKGRIFDIGSEEKWIDLSRINKNYRISNITATLDQNGLLKGTQSTMYTNQMAYRYKSAYAEAKDSMDFVEKTQNNMHANLDSLNITGKEPISTKVTEVMGFNKQIDVADRIYLNPMIFCHLTENDFTQTDRKLPVEFPYPYSCQIVTSIQMPEGYQVEELPKSVKISLDENKGSCQYMIVQEGNFIQMKYLFQLNQVIFPHLEYSTLRDFYGAAVNKNAEMVVLKKI